MIVVTNTIEMQEQVTVLVILGVYGAMVVLMWWSLESAESQWHGRG